MIMKMQELRQLGIVVLSLFEIVRITGGESNFIISECFQKHLRQGCNIKIFYHGVNVFSH